jgi:Zn finger protein HypA/HybF involved in hydrogenase expression
MGESLGTYCYYCVSQKQNGIFIGRGLMLRSVFIPYYCPHCNLISSKKLKFSGCPNCQSSTITYCGRFYFSLKKRKHSTKTGLYEFNPRIVESNLGRKELKDLFNYEKLSLFHRAVLKHSLLLRHFSLYFQIDYSRLYKCPDCNNHQLVIQDYGLIWD